MFLCLYRIIILIQVRILRKGSEVNKPIGQPKQLELVCVPNGNQSADARGNRSNGPSGPGGRGGGGGGAGGTGGNYQGGGNQGGGGGGFRGGNTYGSGQQQQGYRSGGKLLHVYLYWPILTFCRVSAV